MTVHIGYRGVLLTVQAVPQYDPDHVVCGCFITSISGERGEWLTPLFDDVMRAEVADIVTQQIREGDEDAEESGDAVIDAL